MCSASLVIGGQTRSYAPGQPEFLGQLVRCQIAVVLLLVTPHRHDGVDGFVTENPPQQGRLIERVERVGLLARQLCDSGRFTLGIGQ